MIGATRGAWPGRAGAAVVFVLLVMLALVGLGHGLLVSSLGELSASGSGARHLQARMASEAVIHLALRTPARTWMDTLPVGASLVSDSLLVGRARGVGVARRLSRESWLLEGVGGVNGAATVRTGRLTWALDPITRITSLEAVLSVASGSPLVIEGSVDASAPLRVDPPALESDCEPWLAELRGHFLTVSWGIASPTVDSLTGPGLGLLDFTALLRATDVTVGGSGMPGPVERLGVCVLDEPWGWGDPDRPWRPCGPHLVVRGAPAGLEVVGGTGQGVLVVAGDLVLTAGARFYGLVIVHGRLVVERGARLTGAAMASGEVRVTSDAHVVASACWAARALAGQAGALRRLMPVPGLPALGPL